MKLTTQRRIAADLLKCGLHRIWFDPARLTDIKEAITKHDVRSLITNDVIRKRPEVSISGFRRRKQLIQYAKGRSRGIGSRKGKKGARSDGKRDWMNRVRNQRRFLKLLHTKKIITPGQYTMLYAKSKGGFFRSRRHVQLYIEEHRLAHHEQPKEIHPTTKKKK